MIGQKIKFWRERKNLTQEYLAAQLKISQSAYSRLEANETDCSYSRIVEISKILGLKGPEELICGESATFSIMHNEHASGITVNQNKDYRDEYIKVLKDQLSLLQRVVEEALNKRKQFKTKNKS
jgi:transcriptional regulator with XRE-family HTH domain